MLQTKLSILNTQKIIINQISPALLKNIYKNNKDKLIQLVLFVLQNNILGKRKAGTDAVFCRGWKELSDVLSGGQLKALSCKSLEAFH